MSKEKDNHSRSLSRSQREALDVFHKAWSVSALAEHLDTDVDGALDFLEDPTIWAYIEERADRMQKLYARMPKSVYLEIIMAELHNTSESTTATKIQSLLNCFLQWYKEAPAPSNTEFAEAVMNSLREQ